MKCLAFLTVGNALHYIVLLQDIALHIIRIEKNNGHYSEKRGGQNIK